MQALRPHPDPVNQILQDLCGISTEHEKTVEGLPAGQETGKQKTHPCII